MTLLLTKEYTTAERYLAIKFPQASPTSSFRTVPCWILKTQQVELKALSLTGLIKLSQTLDLGSNLCTNIIHAGGTFNMNETESLTIFYSQTEVSSVLYNKVK